MEKLVVDRDKCLGCGMCVSLASQNFDFEDGLASVINEEITEDAKTAMDSCPVGAISTVDK